MIDERDEDLDRAGVFQIDEPDDEDDDDEDDDDDDDLDDDFDDDLDDDDFDDDDDEDDEDDDELAVLAGTTDWPSFWAKTEIGPFPLPRG